MNKLLNEQIIKQVTDDRKMRVNLTRESLLYFSTVYFPHYFSYDFAQFQFEMLQLVEDNTCPFGVVITFRGSGKSTLFTTIAPLWTIMGNQEKKHVVIVCHTQEQARSHMASIKAELESNELLRKDLGPFKETNDTWNALSLEFSKYEAKITAVSIDQSIRGSRYKQHRPDLIICDDIEDSSSVKTKEGRKRIRELYSSEIAPLGDLNTKIVMVGNYLHPNSLLATLRESIRANNLSGKELFIPLINDEGQIAWPQKFPDLASVKQLEERVADMRIWTQEYLLKIVPEEDQLIKYEDIRWYDNYPAGWEPYFQFRAAGVDLAISKNDKADYTAIVSGAVFRHNNEYHIFIDRNPTNERLNFRETIDFLMDFRKVYPDTHLFIESTSYQQSLAQQLLHEGIDAHDVQIGNLSKLERLAAVGYWVRRGQVHFPKDGSTDLVNQMVNFGAEKHDDLVDAFTLLCLQVMEYAKNGSIPQSAQTAGPIIVKLVGNPYSWRSLERASRAKFGRQRFNLRTLAGDPEGW